jgi:hypothetical protein
MSNETDDTASQMASFIGGDGLIPNKDENSGASNGQDETDESGAEIDGDESPDSGGYDSGEHDEDAGGDGEGDGDEETLEENPKRRRSGAERFRRQRERAEAAEARAMALEARLAALEQPQREPELTTQVRNETTLVGQAPDPARYQYGDLDPNYLSDLADFKAEQKVQALRQELMADRQQEVAYREAEVIRDRALQVAEVGTERYPDFNEVVVEGAENDEWPLTETMLQSALDSEKGPDILYYLATHPDEAEKVARMDTRQQDRWFGRMEVQFERPAPRKVSRAPAPVNSARGSGGRFAPDPSTSDFAAFERLANQKV